MLGSSIIFDIHVTIYIPKVPSSLPINNSGNPHLFKVTIQTALYYIDDG